MIDDEAMLGAKGKKGFTFGGKFLIKNYPEITDKNPPGCIPKDPQGVFKDAFSFLIGI